MAKGYFPQRLESGDDVVSLTHVCFDCRETAKGGRERKCPKCRVIMVCVDPSWQTPKRVDDKGWQTARIAFPGSSPGYREMQWEEKLRLEARAERIARLDRKRRKGLV